MSRRPSTIVWAATALGMFAWGTGSWAAVIRVDAAATGANDGTSWADAFPELQSALAAAQASDEIWVAAGTYTPDYDPATDTHPGDREATFELIDGIELYGGFLGTADPNGGETERSQRNPDPATNRTVLGGWGTSYHVVRVTNTWAKRVVLDGFMIGGGHTGGEGDDRHGGGLFVANSTLDLANCRIADNRTWNMPKPPRSFAWSAGHGAGIYCRASTLTLTACAIENNRAGGDDGWNWEYRTFGGRGGDGGGMYVTDRSAVTLVDSEISGNRAGYGWGREGGSGGGVFIEDSLIVVRNSALDDNRAGSSLADMDYAGGDGGDGGGLCAVNSVVEISDSSLTGNRAGSGVGGAGFVTHSSRGGIGGGICARGAPPVSITNTIISSNEAGWPGGSGGGLWFRGNALTMTHCTIVGNHTGFGHYNSEDDSTGGGSGGGLHLNSLHSAGDLTIESCTIADNRTGDGARGASGGPGGGIYFVSGSSSASRATIVNCRITGNETGAGGPGPIGTPVGYADWVAEGGSGGGVALFGKSSGSLFLINCVITGNRTGAGGELNRSIAEVTGGPGGRGGGVLASYGGTIVNCLIANNTTGRGGDSVSDDAGPGGGGGHGGGLYSRSRETDPGSPTVINCTIVDNTAGPGGESLDGATAEHGLAGGVFVETASTLVNSILWGNTAGGEPDESAQIHLKEAIPDITYCDVQGWSGGLGGVGNFGLDPRFADPAYRLGTYSPCVNVGDDAALPADVTTDLDGGPRVFGAAVDLGAHEWTRPPDCNGNGLDDACDLDCDEGGGVCDLAGCGASDDCDANGILDECEQDGDADADGVRDVCDNCSNTPNADQADSDADGLGDACDNCPNTPDDDQADADGDGIGDACEPDSDDDGVIDDHDNCPSRPDPTQADGDDDGVGDVCDDCPNSPPGRPVDGGGCALVPGDFDRDRDVDLEDFGRLQACLSGFGVPIRPGCEPANLNHDRSVAELDMDIFLRCLSGPGIPADPFCAE